MKCPLSSIALGLTTLCLFASLPVSTSAQTNFDRPTSSPAASLLADELAPSPATGTLQDRPGSGMTSFRMPTPPSGGTPGGRYRGGASRLPETCPEVKLPLTALATTYTQPSTSEGSTDAIVKLWGLTTAAHPAFWFYIPEQSATLPAEFALQDENENDVYRSSIALPNATGVMGIRLPISLPALEVGKTYHWYFKIYCDQKKASPPIFVEGTIQRVKLDQSVASAIAAASPQQKLDLYAQHGIWYDALTTLAELRLTDPSNPTLVTNWKGLLQSAGLQDVATAPLIK